MDFHFADKTNDIVDGKTTNNLTNYSSQPFIFLERDNCSRQPFTNIISVIQSRI